MARLAREPADGARDGEPLLGAVLRRRPGEDAERLWHAGRAAEEPGIARLAGDGVRAAGVGCRPGRRMGRQGPLPADRHQRDVSPVVESDPGSVRARPGKPFARARAAVSDAVVDAARPGPG